MIERVLPLPGGRFVCVREDTPRGPGLGLAVPGEQRPTVLLLTGLAFDLTAWPLSLVRGLTDAGLRVLRVDNRDEGRSFRAATPTPSRRALLAGRPPAGCYTIEEMADDAADLLRALHISRAHVLGFSLGGMIAQSLAARHPDLVRGLVSISASTGAPDVGRTALCTRLLLAAPAAPCREVYVRGRLVLDRYFAGRDYPADLPHQRRLARGHWDRSLDPHGENPAMRRQIGAILASGDRTASLAAVTAPTLVLHGDRDPIVRTDGGLATAAAIPRARFDLLPGMGHQLHPLLIPRLLRPVLGHLTDL